VGRRPSGLQPSPTAGLPEEKGYNKKSEKRRKSDMAVIKEIAEMEKARLQAGVRNELHLWREGTFLRAYDWSAWLACRFLHDFKVNKRQFKGADDPVVFIGFPEGSLTKWMPEGTAQRVEEENHLVLTLPKQMLADSMETIDGDYAEWREGIPLTDARERPKKGKGVTDGSSPAADGTPLTLTGVMQRILAFPIESKSPLESMAFLAEVKQRLAQMI